MSIFAISDTHLSTANPKPMDIFGDKWQNHWQQIAEDWQSKVTDEDTVLIAGDISWAMNELDAKPDIDLICNMPGKKVLIKGNHDYWHNSLTKTRAMLYNGAFYLQNDCYEGDDFCIAGTRGWIDKDEKGFGESDAKIYKRELDRLRLSLNAAVKCGKPIIGMMHYPPYAQGKRSSEFTRLFKEFGVKTVVYGHIHGEAFKYFDYSDAYIDDACYILTSCDYLKFKLRRIT